MFMVELPIPLVQLDTVVVCFRRRLDLARQKPIAGGGIELKFISFSHQHGSSPPCFLRFNVILNGLRRNIPSG